MNNNEKYLPIGTVVMLEGGSKRLMITGFCSVSNDNKNVMYDYTGVMYPEGMLASDQTALFNHDQIKQVYHTGLIDEEEIAFKNQLKAIIAKANSVIPGVMPDNSKKANDLNNIPPIGPGLPGYPIKNESEDLSDIPPIGPGLPGYVDTGSASDMIKFE